MQGCSITGVQGCSQAGPACAHVHHVAEGAQGEADPQLVLQLWTCQEEEAAGEEEEEER